MSTLSGRTIGLVGALSGVPRRIAARDVARAGGRLRRGVTRATGLVVLGRGLLARADEIPGQVRAALGEGREVRSENGFFRLLGGAAAPAGDLDREAIVTQSGLDAGDFDLLALFDAFGNDVPPFAFADLILARKYAGLVAGGADWAAIARSVHRVGPAVSLTAKSLRIGEGRRICVSHGTEGLAEIDGQMLLAFRITEEDPDEVFFAAEVAEAEGRHDDAAALFGRCLAIDSTDAVAAFNRGNCLRAAGRDAEAEEALVRAVTLDGAFVEAWFNLAGLLAARGRVGPARAYLARAIRLDPDYADAVFNLATLEYEAGDLAAARRWWERYLELDDASEWAETAARGVRFAALSAMRDAAG